MSELDELIAQQKAEDTSFQPRESFVTGNYDDTAAYADPSTGWHRRVQGCAIHGLENIYVNPGTGRWQCRFCKNDSQRRYYQKNSRRIMEQHKWGRIEQRKKACGDPDCTGYHSTSHKPFSEICPKTKAASYKRHTQWQRGKRG